MMGGREVKSLRDLAQELKDLAGLRFPRGKYEGQLMRDVAEAHPDYIVYAFEHGRQHLNIPLWLYDVCRARVEEDPVEKSLESFGITSTYSRADTPPGLLTGSREPEEPEEPDEPSFLDGGTIWDGENLKSRSFLDSVFNE